MFKMSMNVCPDDILWSAEHCVTKLGMMMQPYEPVCNCNAEKNCSIFKKSRSQEGLIIKILLFLLHFLNCWFFGNQAWSDGILITIVEGVLWEKKERIIAFKVKITALVQNLNDCLSSGYLLSHQTFCYQTWYSDTSSWIEVSCKKTGLVSSRSRSQCYYY